MRIADLREVTAPIANACNVIGNCLATLVIAEWEKAFDIQRAGLTLGNSSILDADR